MNHPILNIELNASIRVIIDSFLGRIIDLSYSIVLTGSQVEETASEESDVDLIIVTATKDQAEKTRAIVTEFSVPSKRALLDCRIYTKNELHTIKSCYERFFIWTCLHKGKVLHGKDITDVFTLPPQIALDSLWGCIQHTQSACDMLDAGVRFTGACYYLYNALTTAFFVEKDVLDSLLMCPTKNRYIRSCLNSDFSRVRERYYWVARHIKRELAPEILRVPTNADKRFSRVDYVKVHSRAVSSVKLLEELYKWLVSWFEKY